MVRQFKNPLTGRMINANGVTARNLLKKVMLGGRNNRRNNNNSKCRKYSDVPYNMFCGPEGGESKCSFPVAKNGKVDAGRCRAALSYSGSARYPRKLRECVERKCKSVMSGGKRKTKSKLKNKSKSKKKNKSKNKSKMKKN